MFSRDNHALTPANDGLAGVIPRADRLAHHYGLYCGYDVTGAALQELPTDLVEIEAARGGIERVRGAREVVRGLPPDGRFPALTR